MRPARDFPPKFERYHTWFTEERVSLAFGDTEVTHVVPRWSEIWRFVPGLTVSFDPLFLKLTVKPGTKRQISLHRGTTWVTSVSPNAKLTLSPVSQVLYRSNFGGKVAFRYKTWLTGERVSLVFGGTEVTHVVPRWSEIWRFVPGLTVSFDPLFLTSLWWRRFRKVSSFLMQGCTSRDKLIDDWIT